MAKSSLLFLVALLFGALSCIDAGPTNAIDQAALLAFYNGLTTAGKAALAWSTSVSNNLCNQVGSGIFCAGQKVVSLSIKDGVEGPISSELSKLSSMTSLTLGNELTGEIPTQLAGMAQLARVEILNAIGITGTLYSGWGATAKLTYLAIAGTSINGVIPTHLGNSKTLTTLHLNDNALSGSIPTEFGGMTALATLALSGNALDSTLPTELAGLSLQSLVVSDNALTGPIPTQFANLMDTLEELSLNNNQLNGMIPNFLDNPSLLASLTLQNNDFCYGVDYSLWATATDYVDNGPACENCAGYCENGGTCTKGTSAPQCACVGSLPQPVCHYEGCDAELYDHTHWDPAQFGTTATGVCQTGYASVSAPERDCSLSSIWSSKPRNRCLTIKCGAEGPWPLTIAGRQSTLRDCPSGVGKRIRVCGITGVWGPVLNYCN